MSEEALKFYSNILSFLYTQIQMRKILTIIGSSAIAVITLLIIGFAFLQQRDWQAEASAALNLSRDYHEQARELTCGYIGELTSDCFKRERGACAELEEQEFAYEEEFGGHPQKDCFGMDEEPEEIETTEEEVIDNPTDPLFFGDEESGTY